MVDRQLASLISWTDASPLIPIVKGWKSFLLGHLQQERFRDDSQPVPRTAPALTDSVLGDLSVHPCQQCERPLPSGCRLASTQGNTAVCKRVRVFVGVLCPCFE